MKCVVGIDLGSTTTKAVLLDEHGQMLGRGITNSRSNYEVACAVARIEALTATRFDLLERELGLSADWDVVERKLWVGRIQDAFRLELFFEDFRELRNAISSLLDSKRVAEVESPLCHTAHAVLEAVATAAPNLYLSGAPRKSEFFRDLAGSVFVAEAEIHTRAGEVAFEPLVGLYDRAILDVETRLRPRDTNTLLHRAIGRLQGFEGSTKITPMLQLAVDAATRQEVIEVAVVGTGYGRQTLPFPKESVRSEILCHGRGAHRVFPGTRTVLDIGGQDTKAIQIDNQGVVTSFQMNDRCAAGCGRYLGYIADELNLGLHELGPLALTAKKAIKVNSTCTVFAGAELRERLSLGQRREDILAGLHRAIMLRAMSLVARSGGVTSEFTFTGGVCNNGMATKVLRDLVDDNYGKDVILNIHPDSIYMGALGAALFALDDHNTGQVAPLPDFVRNARSEIRT